MKRLLALAIALFLAIIIIAPAATEAINYGSGTYGSCTYSICGITISASGGVNLNLTPTTGGSCTIQNNVVSVLTDDSNGYTLQLSNSTTNNSLVDGSSSIGASTGTQASPIALIINSWGYRVDGVGGFGSGPTTAQTNISPPATTFAQVPAQPTQPDTIATTSVAADPAVNTTVWYGACVNFTIPAGSYTTQVTYSAVTN